MKLPPTHTFNFPPHARAHPRDLLASHPLATATSNTTYFVAISLSCPSSLSPYALRQKVLVLLLLIVLAAPTRCLHDERAFRVFLSLRHARYQRSTRCQRAASLSFVLFHVVSFTYTHLQRHADLEFARY